MKTSVYITVTAFDKHSSEFIGASFTASTRKEANKKIKKFEKDIPFTKYYKEINIDIDNNELTPEQEEIVMDLDYN